MSLIRSKNRYVNLRQETKIGEEFTFVVIADPQFGLMERYVEKKLAPFKWDQEKNFLNQAVDLINMMIDKPNFVIVCGDLVDGCLGSEQQIEMINDLKECFTKMNPDIDLLVLPGNHDIASQPSKDDFEAYRQAWGDDYFEFSFSGFNCLCLNSQPFWDNSNCQDEEKEQIEWLSHLLKNKNYHIVFQHIPMFRKSVDEDNDYFNLPREVRLPLLKKLWDAGVQYIFTGHLHYNLLTEWSPSSCLTNRLPMQLITTSSVCVPLASDLPGFRVCKVSKEGLVTHEYFNFQNAQLICRPTENTAKFIIEN